MAEYGKKPLWQWILMYLIVGGIIYALIYYFVLAKQSGGYNYTAPTGTSSYGSSPSGAVSQKSTLTLTAESGSGESGTATLEEVDGKVVVTLALTGFAAGVAQPAHIHLGACPGVGAVKYPLTSLTNGASVTTLDVTMAQLKSELPLAINVHKSAQQASVYVSCGELAL